VRPKLHGIPEYSISSPDSTQMGRKRQPIWSGTNDGRVHGRDAHDLLQNINDLNKYFDNFEIEWSRTPLL
jgi:hypothetical protein